MTGHPPARLHRVLIAELDSVVQSALYQKRGAAAAEEALVGALRAAHLLSGTILVTDSMLLDSRFFTAVRSLELATRLGLERNRLPLHVVSREGSLRHALDAKLADPDFHWQLGSGRPTHTWLDDRIRASWDDWIEAEEAGYVGHETYAHYEHQGSTVAKDDFVFGVDFGAHADHEHVHAFVAQAQEAGPKRSPVYGAHESLRATAPAHVHAELDRLREVWNFAYLQAMADQHHASWITLDLDAEREGAARTAGGTALSISGNLRALITEAPPPVYAQMAFAARKQSERFKEDPSEKNLRELAFALDAATTAPTLGDTRSGATMSVLTAGVAGALSVLQAGQDLSPVRGIVVAFVVFAVTFPWASMRAWRRTGRSHTAGLLAIGGTR
jgi:hypothetical protein